MKILVTILLLMAGVQVNATTYTWTNAGNTTSTTCWSPAGTPTSSDIVIFGVSSPNCTVNAIMVCQSIDFSAYTRQITFTTTITTSGSITMGASMTFSGPSGIVCNTSCTVTPNGCTWGAQLILGNSSNSATYTLSGSDLIITKNSQFGNTTFGNTFNSVGSEKYNIKSPTLLFGTATGTSLFYITGATTFSSTNTVQSSVQIDAGANTVTMNNFFFSTGTLTYTSGTVNNGTSTLTIQGTCTLNTNGINFYNVTLSKTGAMTITLNSALNITNNLSNGNVGTTYTFAGSYGFTTANFLGATTLATLTLVAGNTYNITNSFVWKVSTNSGHLLINSSSGGSKAKIHLTNASTENIGFVDFTDIDASCSTCMSIASWNGVLSNVTNVVSYTAPGTY